MSSLLLVTAGILTVFIVPMLGKFLVFEGCDRKYHLEYRASVPAYLVFHRWTTFFFFLPGSGLSDTVKMTCIRAYRKEVKTPLCIEIEHEHILSLNCLLRDVHYDMCILTVNLFHGLLFRLSGISSVNE